MYDEAAARLVCWPQNFYCWRRNIEYGSRHESKNEVEPIKRMTAGENEIERERA